MQIPVLSNKDLLQSCTHMNMAACGTLQIGCGDPEFKRTNGEVCFPGDMYFLIRRGRTGLKFTN